MKYSNKMNIFSSALGGLCADKISVRYTIRNGGWIIKKVSPSLFSYLSIGVRIPDSQDFCDD